MENKKNEMHGSEQPYEKPLVTRIDLALDETLSAGCKIGDSDCATGSFPTYTPNTAYGS